MPYENKNGLPVRKVIITERQAKSEIMFDPFSLPAQETARSPWIDTDGFDAVTVNVQIGSPSSGLNVVDFFLEWSDDKSRVVAFTDCTGQFSGNEQYKSRGLRTRSRYVRVGLQNLTAADQFIVSAMAYLKP